MIRTQIQLTERQARLVKALARRRGVSMAEIIRQCVDDALHRDTSRSELFTRAASLVGRFPDRHGARDLAERHDDYLNEAFE